MKNLDEFIEQVKVPGKLIFAKVWGSYSHNTQLPHSDLDFMGVYIVPLRQVLSLKGFQDTVNHDKPDYQLHEITKFLSLLAKGNPGVTECLFTEKMVFETDVWLELKQMRNMFLNQNTVNQYVGYARGQLSRLKNGTYLHTTSGKVNEKWMYHLSRLLIDAERICDGGEPIVWKEGKEREFLMRIRNDLISIEEIKAFAEEKLSITQNKINKLPEKANTDLLDEWLFKLRLGA